MVRTPERDGRQALRARLRDRQGDAVARHDLAESLVAVETRDRRGLELGLDGRRRIDVPGLEGVDVVRDADHAVRVVAAEIGAHEQGRDPGGVLVGRLPGGEDVARDPFERLDVDHPHAVSSPDPDRTPARLMDRMREGEAQKMLRNHVQETTHARL